MIVTVLGNGGFGTAMAIAALRAGNETRLWGHDRDYTAEVAATRTNARYLPGVSIPVGVDVGANAARALAQTEAVLVAVPTQHVRAVVSALVADIPAQVPLISLSKGLELDTGKRPSEVLREAAPKRPVFVLSGPSHAEEIARGMPATVVLAGDPDAMREMAALQSALSGESLRIYQNGDPLGVELCGALKNVMAIATGIAEGLGLGDNAKAATLARGLVEMQRFGLAAGALAATFMGIAGVGDLAVTAFSKHGRNRAFGERIGAGETVDQILASTRKVAEGVWTSKVVLARAEELAVEMPICAAVCSVLFDGVPAAGAVRELMQREYKSE